MRVARNRPPAAAARQSVLSSRGGTVEASIAARLSDELVTSTEQAGMAGELFALDSADQTVMDLLKSAKPPMEQFRYGNYVHVSDIISKCARKIALLRRLGGKHTPQRLMDGHAITFAQGNAIGDFIKRRFMEGHPDKVWAKWRCKCGATTTEPMTLEQMRSVAEFCQICDKQPSEYVEVGLPDDEHEVIGSPDIILYFDHLPAFYPIEVKSMAKEAWESLVRPIPDHIVQGLFYWRLMQKKRFSLVNQFSLLYVKKEYTWKSPYKEFIIKPLECMRQLDIFLGDLDMIVAARNPAAPLPPRIICPSIDAPSAKSCPVCVSCFQLP